MIAVNIPNTRQYILQADSFLNPLENDATAQIATWILDSDS